MKEKNVKKIGLIVGIVLFTLCVLGLTYAYLQKILFADLTVDTITQGLDYYINYTKGQDVTGVLEPTSDYEEGSSAQVTFYKKDNTYDIYGHIYLDVSTIGTNLSNSPALKYTLTSSNIILKEGTLQGTTSNSSVPIKLNIPLKTTSTKYKLYIWLDENEEPGDISDETITASIRCDATMKPIGALGKIVNLFTKTGTVTNNGITYDIDATHGLIDTSMMYKDLEDSIVVYKGDVNADGKLDADDASIIKDAANKGTTLNTAQRLIGDIDNNNKIDSVDTTLVYFIINEKIEKIYLSIPASTEGASNYILDKKINTEIRYYGQNPNNYIDIGDNVLWRIIGVFDGKLKIIRSSSIGDYVWNSNQVNDWSTASLKTYLNSGDYYTSGITGTAKDKIAEVTWNLGGVPGSSIYPNAAYTMERGTTVYSGRPTTWTGKIGLAYPSDYGYATDLQECNQTLNNYSNAGTNSTYPCRGNNWMWYAMTGETTATSTSGTKIAWLLTPNSSHPYLAWHVNTTGYVYNSHAYNAFAVSPVLYLSSEQVIESGSGTSSDPYVLSA